MLDHLSVFRFGANKPEVAPMFASVAAFTDHYHSSQPWEHLNTENGNVVR
jgi:hypothetical protein